MNARSDVVFGRIGPNAITRVAEALGASGTPDPTRAVFRQARLLHRLDTPPSDMIDDGEVARLHLALHETLGAREAARVSLEAGRLTGEYLLAHRIPRLAQRVLRALPRPLAARVLVRAIARHAWTFAGSGAFSYAFRDGLTLRLAGSPVCRHLHTDEPACQYYAATFERVFAAMLGPSLRVRETTCGATGAPACTFAVTW